MGHADDQPEDLQRTAKAGRPAKDQLGLALPVACTQATQIGPTPPLTMANAAQPSLRALSWQRVLTRRHASPLLTSNALTWGWAQLVSNQRPFAWKDCHHHSPGLRFLPSAQVRTEQERAQPSTTEQPRAKCAPTWLASPCRRQTQSLARWLAETDLRIRPPTLGKQSPGVTSH